MEDEILTESGSDGDGDSSESEYEDEEVCSTSGSSSDGSSDSDYTSSSDDEKAVKTKKKKKKKGNKSFPCYVCGKTLRKQCLLEQHLRTHSEERPFSCPACPKSYKTNYHLQRHINSSHDDRAESKTCSWPGCTYSSPNPYLLNRHLALHEKKGKLLRHRDRSSEAPKRYACHEKNCGKVFKYRCRLRLHEELNHGQSFVDVICGEPGCGERFDHPSDLSHHMRNSHKYVICEVCGEATYRANIKRHYRSHDTIKPEKVRLPCPYPDCSRSYNQENNLRMHLKISHLKMKPYKCSFPDCGKTFGYRSVRDRHEKALHISGDFLEEDEAKEMKTKKKNKGGRPKKRKVVENITDMFVQRQPSKRTRNSCKDEDVSHASASKDDPSNNNPGATPVDPNSSESSPSE